MQLLQALAGMDGKMGYNRDILVETSGVCSLCKDMLVGWQDGLLVALRGVSKQLHCQLEGGVLTYYWSHGSVRDSNSESSCPPFIRDIFELLVRIDCY